MNGDASLPCTRRKHEPQTTERRRRPFSAGAFQRWSDCRCRLCRRDGKLGARTWAGWQAAPPPESGNDAALHTTRAVTSHARRRRAGLARRRAMRHGRVWGVIDGSPRLLHACLTSGRPTRRAVRLSSAHEFPGTRATERLTHVDASGRGFDQPGRGRERYLERASTHAASSSPRVAGGLSAQ